MKKYYIFILIACCFFSGNIISQEYEKAIANYLNMKIAKNELSVTANAWVMTSEHISSISGVHHIYFSQLYNDIPILGTESSIHVSNKLVTTSGSLHFKKHFSKYHISNSNPAISPIEAVQIVADYLNKKLTKAPQILKNLNNSENDYIVSDGGISFFEIPVSLRYWQETEEKLVLIWELLILDPDMNYWWNVKVNASSGEILEKRDIFQHCNFESECDKKDLNYHRNLYEIPNYKKNDQEVLPCENCYEVVAIPSESPYFGDRTIVINPASQIASEYGWHDLNGNIIPESLYTHGNNVEAYIGNVGYLHYQPYGGENLDFTQYLFEQEWTNINRYHDASVTNLFYWNNILHDILFTYGFDEAAGNFQAINYSSYSGWSDEVIAMSQVDLATCNASFGVSVDGLNPIMKMNICGDKDGALDNVVIIHEYIHGLTSRLIGGSNNPSCTDNSENMKEGWSDWYALMLTMQPEDIGERPRGIGTYLKGEGPDGTGVREYYYSTDMNVNPLTYDYIKTTSGIHNVGAVWGTILWEVTWALIAEHGFDPDITNFTGDINKDAGNIMALAIVTEAIKKSSCGPGFVEGRDNILSASIDIYGIDNECFLWTAFAKRGLGYGATQGSSNNTSDGVESFEMPPRQASLVIVDNRFCLNSGVVESLGGGYPKGGIYSGPGVIDLGNGALFNFNPSIAGAGVHVIFYEVPNGPCTDASIANVNLEVFLDIEKPVFTCPEDLKVLLGEGESKHAITDYTELIEVSDNCELIPRYQQIPEPGALIGAGETIVTIIVSDVAGNQTSCEFVLSVEGFIKENKDIVIHPNPATHELSFQSPADLKKVELLIFDIRGVLVDTISFEEFGYSNTISVANYSSGLYLIKIRIGDSYFMKKFIKY